MKLLKYCLILLFVASCIPYGSDYNVIWKNINLEKDCDIVVYQKVEETFIYFEGKVSKINDNEIVLKLMNYEDNGGALSLRRYLGDAQEVLLEGLNKIKGAKIIDIYMGINKDSVAGIELIKEGSIIYINKEVLDEILTEDLRDFLTSITKLGF